MGERFDLELSSTSCRRHINDFQTIFLDLVRLRLSFYCFQSFAFVILQINIIGCFSSLTIFSFTVAFYYCCDVLVFSHKNLIIYSILFDEQEKCFFSFFFPFVWSHLLLLFFRFHWMEMYLHENEIILSRLLSKQ